MKQIPLTQGRFALVDDSDYPQLIQYKWQARNHKGLWYAWTTVYENGKYLKGIGMHRMILNAPKGILVDHKNGNGLDNQRSNIRLCGSFGNSCNRKVAKDNKLGVKGVIYDAKYDLFRASICSHRKIVYLGSFRTLDEAREAYNSAAPIFHGEFARKS